MTWQINISKLCHEILNISVAARPGPARRASLAGQDGTGRSKKAEIEKTQRVKRKKKKRFLIFASSRRNFGQFFDFVEILDENIHKVWTTTLEFRKHGKTGRQTGRDELFRPVCHLWSQVSARSKRNYFSAVICKIASVRLVLALGFP